MQADVILREPPHGCPLKGGMRRGPPHTPLYNTI